MPNYILEETKIEFIQMIIEASSITEANKGNFRIIVVKDSEIERQFHVMKEVDDTLISEVMK